MSARHWHVLGAGAIGSLFAVRLRKAGCEVTLVTRQGASAIVNLSMVDAEGRSEHRFPACGADRCASVSHLLVATKAYDVALAVGSIAHRLTAASEVLVLANGMGFAEELDAACPTVTPYFGTTTEGAYRSESGELHHAGRGTTLIGRGTETDPPDWFEDWRLATTDCRWEYPIDTALWRKLAINCAINPLTAVNGCRNGGLLEQEALSRRVGILCREIAAISEVAGHSSVARDLPTTVEQVIRGTAANYSSMLQDVRAGKRTEIDYMTGYLLEFARRHGVPAPENYALLEEVRNIGK